LQLIRLRVAFYLKMTKKQQFLLEHNKLSPLNLQATISLLSRFRIEKAVLFKDDNWSLDKLRRPFILWLTSLTAEEKENIKPPKASLAQKGGKKKNDPSTGSGSY